jgi:[acyl-carrier-protein] S-malonyltransferase
MGRDLAEHHSAAGRAFQEAEVALGLPLKQLCFEGPEEVLKETANAQPAIVTASIAAYRAYTEAAGPRAGRMAGHSLGEYSALIAAEALDLETGIRLVRQRGEHMAEAARHTEGGMAAILGLDNALLQQMCDDDSGVVVIANLNSPGQAVISGESEAVERVGEAAKEAGAKRVVPLAVSGAFHSPLMREAAEAMRGPLFEAAWSDPTVPVYSNVTAQPVQDTESIPGLLAEQIVSGVRWEETVRDMIADGIQVFVELGPGKVLSGLIRRIDPSVTLLNAEDTASLEKTLAALYDLDLE